MLVVSVRPATLADMPVMLAMGAALHAESPRYQNLRYSPEKVEALGRRALEDTLVTPAAGGLFVAEKNARIIGMVFGFVTEFFFSTDKVASDHTLYVVPEERGKSPVAGLLIRALEKWAAEQGAVDIVPGTSTQIAPEATVKLYERLGYERYGYVMRKRIKP